MVNLDDLSNKGLINLARRIYLNKDRAAERMFPDKPNGYMDAIMNIQTYCWFSALAQSRREEGETEKSLACLEKAMKAYEKLPDYARW